MKVPIHLHNICATLYDGFLYHPSLEQKGQFVLKIYPKPTYCEVTSICDLTATSRSVSMIVQFLMNSLVRLSTYQMNISTKKHVIG